MNEKQFEYVCKICNKHYIGIRAFSNHIVSSHKITTKEYYDTYIKQKDDGICEICNKPTKYRSFTEGYKNTCSHKCYGKWLKKHPEIIKARSDKTKNTCMKKWGVENPFQVDSVKQKIKETNLNKYGTEYFSKTNDWTIKTKNTNLNKYGSDTYLHSDIGRIVVNLTNKKRYGNPNYFLTSNFKNKSENTSLLKYNAKTYMQSEIGKKQREYLQKNTYNGYFYVETEDFKNKAKNTQYIKYGNWYSSTKERQSLLHNTNMRLYGNPEYFKSDDFKLKNKETLLDRYNVTNYSMTEYWKNKTQTTNIHKYNNPVYLLSNDFKEKTKKTCMKKYGNENYFLSETYKNKLFESYKIIMQNSGCDIIKVITYNSVMFKCNKCGNVNTEQIQFIKSRINNNITPCAFCEHKNTEVSIEESEVSSYIKELGYNITHYDTGFIGNMGADIVIEDKKLIIEYDGIYWHSELYKDPNYHLLKTIEAEKLGYKLIHIFSDEWKYKKEIVKSRLLSQLGIIQNKIYARKCEIKEVSNKDSVIFLDLNHLQGSCTSSLRYGLYNNEELVAIMTFGKSRFNDDEYELIRYCNKCNGAVVGGASKLFKHFLKNNTVKNIISFADRRWSGKLGLYSSLGFKLEYETPPSYFYINSDMRESRIKYMKHKLIKAGYDSNKTEHDIMFDRGIYRIYDCGHLKFSYSI